MSEDGEAKVVRKATRRRLATLNFFARMGLMCLSFLLSLMLFLYVQSQTAPLITRTLEARLHAVPQSDLYYSEEGAPIDVKVTGTQSELAELEQDQPSKLVAVVNVQSLISSLKPPETSIARRLPVTIKPPAGMDDLVLEYSSIRSVDLEIEKRVLREVEIRSAGKGGGPLTLEQLSKVDVEPPVVWLTGPASYVDDARPFIEIDFSELGQPEAAKVRLAKRDQTPLETIVTSDPDKVQVSKVRDQASAFLNVKFRGHPALGYEVTGYEIQPASSVQLTGPPELVGQTKSVDVDVDVSDLRSSKMFTVVPELKRGLQLAPDQLMPIVVTVTIERRRR